MYVASRLISHASPSWQTWCTRELAHAVPGGRHTRAHARAETWRWPPGRSQQTKALSGTGPHRKELQRVRHWAAQERAAAGTALGRTGKSCSGYVHSSTTVRAILTTVPVPGQAREALSSRKSTGSPRVALPATTLPPVRYNPPAGSLQPSRRFAPGRTRPSTRGRRCRRRRRGWRSEREREIERSVYATTTDHPIHCQGIPRQARGAQGAPSAPSTFSVITSFVTWPKEHCTPRRQ
jgi:hypothetical protein